MGNYWIFLLLLCLLSQTLSAGDGNNAGSHFEIYTKLFALKRKEQVDTAEQVWAINDFAKQYKTVEFLMKTILPEACLIKVLKQSLSDVTEMSFKPGDPFPDPQDQREVLGKIYENVLFLGDVLLRMPDITKKIYRKHKKEWQSVLEDSIQFCNESRELFNGPYAIQLHLVAQELGIIPEEEDYINPFRKIDPQPVKSAVLPSKGKKKEKRSGPKLRGSKLEL